MKKTLEELRSKIHKTGAVTFQAFSYFTKPLEDYRKAQALALKSVEGFDAIVDDIESIIEGLGK